MEVYKFSHLQIKTHFRAILDKEISPIADPTKKGHAFLRWVLRNVFDKAEEEYIFNDAPYDFGIDAYLEEENETYVFQSKYGSSHKPEAISGFRKDFENFKKTDIDKLGLKLHNLKKMVNEGKQIALIYVTDVDITSEETEDAKAHGVHVYDLDDMTQEIWKRIVEPYKGKVEQLNVAKMVDYKNYYVCIVSLKDLAKFIDKSWEYIFQSNIRQWLQFRTKVNRNMRETLKTDTSSFFKYNNGVTLVCDDVKPINGQTIEMTSPQIVNGAQTCSAIVVSWKDNINLEGEVLATVMKAVSPEEMNTITRFRNSQNAIRGKDFVSLEDFHKEIKLMLLNYGYFYEVQAGSFALLDPNEQAKYVGDNIFNEYLPTNHKHDIPSKEAIQSYVAGLIQNPTDSYGRLYKFMPPDGENYKDAFPSDLPHDYRILLFPYLVREYAKSQLEYGTRPSGKEWKVNSTLFFVAVYFRLLSKLLDFTGIDLTKMDLNKLEKIFRAFDLNKQILNLTDNIVCEFMKDSQVFKKTKVVIQVEAGTQTLFDYPTFFKTHAYKDEFKDILEEKTSLFSVVIDNLKSQIAALST